MRQHPTVGSPHATFNAGNYIAPFPQVRYSPDARRKSDAERVSDIVARLRTDKDWCTERTAITVRTIGMDCEAAADIIEAQSKALAEARETNRRLNRTNQKLHSDIASDRHLLTTFDTPWTPDTAAQVSVERQSWPHKRDTAMLHFHKESVRYRKALEKLRSYNVDIAAERINYRSHDHIQVIDAALTPTPENPNG